MFFSTDNSGGCGALARSAAVAGGADSGTEELSRGQAWLLSLVARFQLINSVHPCFHLSKS